VLLAAVLLLHFVPSNVKKSVAHFVTQPNVVSAGLGVMAVMALLFFGSMLKVITSYRTFNSFSAELNQVIFERNGLLCALASLLTLLVYNVAKLTEDAYRKTDYSFKDQSSYDRLTSENRALRQRIAELEKTFAQPKKAV